MHHGEFIESPDFVVLGVPAPDGNGVWVVASQTLTLAEVRQALDHDFGFDPLERRMRNEFRKAFELSCTMRDLVVVEGIDYGEAFRKLFASWTPPERVRPGLPSPPASVELAGPRPALERETGVGWGKQPRTR